MNAGKRLRAIGLFGLLASGLFFAWKLAAEEPISESASLGLPVSPGLPSSRVIVPAFTPPSQSTEPPPDAAVLMLARLRKEIGSPLDSSTWQPYQGNSPLAIAPLPEASNESLTTSIKQLQATAVSLEAAAALQEHAANYQQADQLRQMAKRLWKDARRIQGWSQPE